MIFQGSPLLSPPDNLTIPQLVLDLHHPARPIRKQGNPWLVDDPTGKAYGFEELRSRVQGGCHLLVKYFQETQTARLSRE